MLIDIFSSLDPIHRSAASIRPILIWASPWTLALTIGQLWATPTIRATIINLGAFIIIKPAFKSAPTKIKGFIHYATCLGIVLLSRNLFGLLPFTPALSRQPLFVLTISLVVWLTLIISSASFNLSIFATKFIPENTPVWLARFLTLVEVIRSIVRPLTLALRLIVNIAVGHLLVKTICSLSCILVIKARLVWAPIIIMLRCSVFLLEVFVVLIQSYIFVILVVIYFEEHTRHPH